MSKEFIEVGIKLDSGKEPEITRAHVTTGSFNHEAIEALKGTKFEHESLGLKLYEKFSVRNTLDLNSSILVISDDVIKAKEAVLELFNN